MIIQRMSLADLFMWVSFFLSQNARVDLPFGFPRAGTRDSLVPSSSPDLFLRVLLNVELLNLGGGVIWLLLSFRLERGCARSTAAAGY